MDAGNARTYRMGELERITGMPRHSIHRLLKRGVLPPPIAKTRTSALYDDRHVELLEVIKDLRGGERVPISFLKRLIRDKNAPFGASIAERGAPKDPARVTRTGIRRSLKASATRLFVEKGYGSTRIRDITARSGVSIGSFYLHFHDKREIFMEVVDDLIQEITTTVKSAAGDEDPETLIGKAKKLARFYMENYTRYSGLLNQLRGMMTEKDPSAEQKYRELHSRLAEPLALELEKAMDKGLIRRTDPVLLAKAVMGMVEFLAFYLSFDKRRTVEEAVDFMFDVLLRGLDPRIPSAPSI